MSYLTEIARSVVPYDPSDKAALRAFQRAYFGRASRQCDDIFSEWLFERNPHRDASRPSIWLCKRDGVVVGQQASIPVLLKANELQFRAAWLIDLMVHPAWRLKGIAPALTAAHAKNNEVILGLGLEDTVYRSFRRSGWTDLGTLLLFVRPLDPRACAEGLNAPKLLANLVPRVLTRGTASIMGKVSGGLTRISFEPIQQFDERVDGACAAATRDYPLLVKRDFASLRWRFDEIPYHARYERYYLVRRGKVIGYVVMRCGNWHGYTVARVVDYMSERRWLSALFALAIAEANANGAVAVFIEHLHAGCDAILTSLGCVRVRASERFISSVRERDNPLAGKLAHAARWFVSPADSDLDQIAVSLEPTRAHATR